MNSQGSQSEKRFATRVKTEEATVTYRRKGFWTRIFGGAASESSLPIRNISQSGICFMCTTKLKRGQLLAMVISVHGESEGVPVRGEVIWVGQGDEQHPYRAGVRFAGMTGEVEGRLIAVTDKIATTRTTGPGERSASAGTG